MLTFWTTLHGISWQWTHCTMPVTVRAVPGEISLLSELNGPYQWLGNTTCAPFSRYGARNTNIFSFFPVLVARVPIRWTAGNSFSPIESQMDRDGLLSSGRKRKTNLVKTLEDIYNGYCRENFYLLYMSLE